MSGLLGNLRRAMPTSDAMAGARGAIDSLPAVMDALSRLPAIVRDMPPAPVVLGAVSHMVADAIAGELRKRGPSDQFRAACERLGVGESADVLFAELVAEIGR